MRLFIDAGHNFSGKDTGAKGHGLKEEILTFQIAEKVAQKLQQYDVAVQLSRLTVETSIANTSLSASLSARAAMSDAFKADYCISIHVNAGGGYGCEVFSYPGNTHTALFARTVCNRIANTFGWAPGRGNRGQKTANYAMLRQPAAPAILIECAFIDNAIDAQYLQHGQDTFAEAIVSGIAEFLDLQKINRKADVEMAKVTIVKKMQGGDLHLEVDGAKCEAESDGLFISEGTAGTTRLANLLRALGHEVMYIEY